MLEGRPGRRNTKERKPSLFSITGPLMMLPLHLWLRRKWPQGWQGQGIILCSDEALKQQCVCPLNPNHANKTRKVSVLLLRYLYLWYWCQTCCNNYNVNESCLEIFFKEDDAPLQPSSAVMTRRPWTREQKRENPLRNTLKRPEVIIFWCRLT